MNQHLIILKDWKLDWDKVDDVDFENRSSVQDSLRLFILHPYWSRTFSSCIPFRISGRIYRHPNYTDGQEYLTANVREIRRLNLTARSASFEVETWSGTFVVRAEEAAGWIQG